MTLVGYWPLDESSGEAKDHSGNENHGTVNGATQGSTGILGRNAYSFNGSSDDVSLGDSTTFTGFDSFSVSLWAKFGTNSVSSNMHLFSTAGSNTNEWQVDLQSSTDQIRFYVKTGSGSSGPESITPSTDTWVYIVGVYDGSTVYNYIDGVKENTASLTGTVADNGNSTHIGAEDSSSGNFDGEICDVRLYNHALSPNEIAYLYHASQKAQYLSKKKTS